MGQRAYQVSAAMSLETARSAQRRRSGLLPLVVPAMVLGGLAMLHVVSLARLSELDYEAKRLERLSLDQSMRRAELLREHGRLTSQTILTTYAVQRGLVPAGEGRPLPLGSLPERQVYWQLPGETGPAGTGNGAMVGWQLPLAGAPPAPGQ
jgi:hypothetical protein